MCERCWSRFISYAESAQEAEEEVSAAFNGHDCGHIAQKGGTLSSRLREHVIALKRLLGGI
jgi:hypothetical protein